MQYEILPWLILFLPLLAAAVITLFTLKCRNVSALLSIGAIAIGFVSTVAFIAVNGWVTGEVAVNWLSVGGLNIDFGLKLDRLSEMMMLIVTGVGGAIHIYSYGYMDADRSKARFFAFMSLFTFSMLGIVLANNFIELFIFWELVGVSSYLLIGFWFEKPSAADAAKKAFFTNRLGDFGFLLGILVVWTALGSLNFSALQQALAANPAALGTIASAAGLLIFCGAMGKSAQFPLHVWLPDAMEGPTPVSALIHAATMVAAGVYMLCRIIFLLDATALQVIACIGGFTALLAALIAVQQNDIKRILAYSTLSQLGYMVMAVGLAGPTPAMFHLTTHAFFKALLFLGAGSVIHALHEEQDIWKMGGLRDKMGVTFWTFLVGTLALSGVPPFSGFYSKDSILGQALGQKNDLLFAVGVGVAGLTAFYMFRLFYVAFAGKPRTVAAGRAHESPAVMTWPLLALALFSIIGGVIGASGIFDAQFSGEVSSAPLIQRIFEPLHSPVAMTLGLLAVAVGFFAARKFYLNAETDPLPAKLGGLAVAMKNKFYFDEIYEATFIRAHDFIAAVMDVIDRWLVEGFCIGLVRGGTDFTGRALRLVQTGNLQTYALLFVLGVAVVLYLVLVNKMSILTYILGWPLVAALALVVVPRNYRVIIRAVAVLATLIPAALAVKMFCAYGHAPVDADGYRFVQQIPWVESLGISYHVGVDGLNVGLILMGAIVAFAAACCSWEIKEREKEFYILLLVMSGGILGAFASLDLFFFYFLHELALVPTFIMIGVWGRGERKNYATFQITLYLSIGALIALIGLIALYLQSGANTFDIPKLIEHARTNPLAASAQNFIFPLLLFGFGILVSLWPFHSWAPLGYSSAPSPTAMLHAGVLKKFGLYGLIRIALPLMPQAAHGWMNLLAWLCLGNILYVGWVAMRQKDLNLLIGNSSVAHMGFVFLGIASLNLIGVTGAVVIMIAHGFLAALTFALSGYIYQQTGTLEMNRLGGLCRQLPFIGTALLMAALAGCGLPGFANFVGEVTVFFGAWTAFPLVTALAVWGALLIGALYMLRAMREVLHGPLPEKWAAVPDASNAWRKLPYALLLAGLFGFGCFPRLLTDKITPDAAKIVSLASPAETADKTVAQASLSKLRTPNSELRN